MIRILFLVLPLCFAVSPTWGQSEYPPRNSAQIQVGSDYFGQSIGFSYSRRLTGPFWVGLAFETQSISFKSVAGQTFFGLNNDSDTNFNIGLDIHDFLTADIALDRSDSGEFRWLNLMEVGLTHFDLTYYLSFVADSSDMYSGQRDISAFAVFTEVHLLDFYPPKDKIFFSFGIKGSTAFLPSPQTVVVTDGSGNKTWVSYANANGGAIMVPDIELFLGIGYLFQ